MRYSIFPIWSLLKWIIWLLLMKSNFQWKKLQVHGFNERLFTLPCFSTCRRTFDVFVGGGELYVLLFHHLDSPVPLYLAFKSYSVVSIASNVIELLGYVEDIGCGQPVICSPFQVSDRTTFCLGVLQTDMELKDPPILPSSPLSFTDVPPTNILHIQFHLAFCFSEEQNDTDMNVEACNPTSSWKPS